MGTAERRKREKMERARQIRKAAEKIFLEKGFQAATIQGIAREAELSIGTIYLYYKTKEEIFAAINLRFIERVDRGLEDILADEARPADRKLEAAWGLLSEVYCATPLSLRALAHGLMQGALQDISPPLLERLNLTSRNILKRLTAIMQQGMDRGVFESANPVAVADLFWGTFTGVTSWEAAKRTTDRQKDYLGPTLDLAWRTFIRGISSPGGEKS